MGGKAMWGGVALAVMLVLPAAASSQAQSMKAFQVADAEQMGDKFAGLAESFTEAQYDWRPMEGVRSVREVLALAVAEANLFPAMWGVAPPSGIGEGFGGEMARVSGMSKSQMVAELNKAFGYLKASLEGMSADARMADGTTFGRQMKVDAGISLAMADMHEHLGQLIAYARTNKVVPPWSRDMGD